MIYGGYDVEKHVEYVCLIFLGGGEQLVFLDIMHRKTCILQTTL